ncbi:unnamed protein product, partial [Ixodes pacificus]
CFLRGVKSGSSRRALLTSQEAGQAIKNGLMFADLLSHDRAQLVGGTLEEREVLVQLGQLYFVECAHELDVLLCHNRVELQSSRNGLRDVEVDCVPHKLVEVD